MHHFAALLASTWVEGNQMVALVQHQKVVERRVVQIEYIGVNVSISVYKNCGGMSLFVQESLIEGLETSI